MISLFQCGGLCENSKKRKKKELRKKKEKKKEEEKESVKKEENKEGSYQILRSEMEGRNTALKRRRGEKKKCSMEIPKRVDIPTNLENTSYIYLHPFLFYSLYFYPTLRPNKVLI